MAILRYLLSLALIQLHSAVPLVDFNKAGIFTAISGERIALKCSATAKYTIEVLEIGEIETIDGKIFYGIPQLGDPSMSYRPEECQHFNNDSDCSKIVYLTVNASMDGKSYQCRIIKSEGNNNHYIYSQGGYLRVNSTTPTTSVPRLSLAPQSSGDPSSETVLFSPSPTTPLLPTATMSQYLPSITPSDYGCECNAGNAFKAVHGNSLLVWTLLLPLAVFL